MARPKGTNNYNVKQFADVIPGTGGIITSIAAKVGCAWHPAKKYIDGSPTLTQMVEDEAHKVDDMAESVIITAIKDKDIQTAKWWLERRRRDEFSTRSELTGANGGAVEHKITGLDKALDAIYSDGE